MARKPAKPTAPEGDQSETAATEVAQDATAAPVQADPAADGGHDDGRSVTSEDGSDAAIDDLTAPAFVVICHRAGGRRRAGRRWPEGESTVKEFELTAYQLAQLQGDPQFTVAAVIERG